MKYGKKYIFKRQRWLLALEKLTWWSLKGKVDLRSCWFRRRWPTAPLPYEHSPHLVDQSFYKLENPRPDKYRNQVQSSPRIVRWKSRSWLLLDIGPAQRGPMVAVLVWVLAFSSLLYIILYIISFIFKCKILLQVLFSNAKYSLL